jgi:hypothetical protein
MCGCRAPAGSVSSWSCSNTSDEILGTSVCRCSRCAFTDCDSVLVTVSEDGFSRRYDVESGKLLLEEQIHNAEITDMQV